MANVTRKSNDRIIAGVSAALAERFDLSTTLVRVLFVISIFFGSLGFWAYIILWIVLPSDN